MADSSWRSLAIGDDAFLRGTADTGAPRNALDANGASIPVVLGTAIEIASVGGQLGNSSAAGLVSSRAVDDVDNEPVVQILSRLLVMDKGESMSGVEAEEEIGTHPD